MATENLHATLKRIRGVRDPCDLDLLLFFHRHPCALLTSEEIVAYVGYHREQVAKSLDRLIEAGLLKRSQNAASTSRMYVLEQRTFPGGSLSSFLKIAATRQGRSDILKVLKSEGNALPSAHHQRSAPIIKIA